MNFIQIIFIILILLPFIFFTWLILLSVKNSIKYKVPQVATFSSDFKVMKKWLKKYQLKWKILVDLWSWTWRSIRFFEREFKMKTTWYEIDHWNVIISRILNCLYKNKAIIKQWNYLKEDLSSFDVIYLYWFPVLMAWIEKKVWNNCKKWTLIISNAFPFSNHEPVETLLNEKGEKEVYIYKI